MSFELLSVAQVGAAAVWSLALFWWVETPRVEWRPAVVWRDTGNRIAGHCAGFYHPGVGAAVHHLHPDGADLHAGAGVRLDDLLLSCWVRAFRDAPPRAPP